MSHKRIFVESELRDLYINKKLSYVKIARYFSASKNTIMKNINSLGIEREPGAYRLGTVHTQKELRKMSLRRRAAWRAGKYKNVGLAISVAKRGKMSDVFKAGARERMIARLKAGVYNVKPTVPEKKIIAYVAQRNLPFKFVGDGKFWIENINPDFVNVNGEKQAIDVHGCYWHNCPKCFPNNTGYKGTALKDPERLKIYKKYGWTVTTLWEHDIKQGRIDLH